MPTAAEVDILAVLWRLGPATVREVHDALDKDSGYNTTLKQMQLMMDKGLLVRTERFGAHVYESRVPMEQMQKQIAGDLMRRVFGGSVKNLVMGVLGAQSASVISSRSSKRPSRARLPTYSLSKLYFRVAMNR